MDANFSKEYSENFQDNCFAEHFLRSTFVTKKVSNHYPLVVYEIHALKIFIILSLMNSMYS